MSRLLLVAAAVSAAALCVLDASHARRRRARLANDLRLVESVRASMSRHVAHPGSVDVSAAGGVVTLSGSIPAHEHSDFIDAVSDMTDVARVVDRLSVFERAAGISELQGDGPQPAQQPETRASA
jgi:osmotically-inducible protein OsmY